jgi:hypothetical protein
MNPKDSHVNRNMNVYILFDPYGIAPWVKITFAINM